MRRLLVLPVLLAAGALPAMPAVAKEGVRAKLDRPVRLDAAPGRAVRVVWRLVDEDGRPFGASGIYLRVSRCGRPPLRVHARERAPGRYSARVTVPRGGIRKLVVGLKAWRIVGERRERADALFPFEPVLRRRCS
jgi:hypothetical protein